MPKGTLIIKDPEVAKLFADETRRGILHMLRHREMSTTNLAKALEKNHSSIIHHLNLLKDAGLVELVREEKVRNMVQAYYKSTAFRYIISYSLTELLTDDEGYTSWREGILQKMFEDLEIYGIKIPPEKKDRVMELMEICYEKQSKAYEESLEEQVDSAKFDRHTQPVLGQLIINMKLNRDKEYHMALKELEEILMECR
ncbi:helix-turn-helix transcriptional regulator [Candidatus Bathyarchaeota archaeon]|nr:helix-turn-helix transcriptional regulator [Candidatus Bathyarchaeota archaeon]